MSFRLRRVGEAGQPMPYGTRELSRPTALDTVASAIQTSTADLVVVAADGSNALVASCGPTPSRMAALRFVTQLRVDAR
jgi:hypothetical protein